jgi:hypothetical protein
VRSPPGSRTRRYPHYTTSGSAQLPAQNRTADPVINDLSVTDKRVVISKDTDFYYSHVLYECLSMRMDAEFHDEDDVRFLLRHLDIEATYEEPVEVITRYYPLERFA